MCVCVAPLVVLVFVFAQQTRPASQTETALTKHSAIYSRTCRKINAQAQHKMLCATSTTSAGRRTVHGPVLLLLLLLLQSLGFGNYRGFFFYILTYYIRLSIVDHSEMTLINRMMTPIHIISLQAQRAQCRRRRSSGHRTRPLGPFNFPPTI